MADQKRHAAGTPAGGRFAEGAHDESDLDLAPHANGPAAEDPQLIARQALSAELDDGPEDIEAMIEDDDPLVRCDAAMRLDISPDQLRRLSDPDAQPVLVRLACATLPYRGVGSRASHDPDPIVRAIAADAWDLPESDRARLSRDPEVTRFLELVSA